MALRQSTLWRRATGTSPKRKAASGRSGPRRLAIEPFEERALLAVGPQLVAVIPNQATLLNDNQVLNVAPTELTFRFDSAIDPNSLFNGGTANIQITARRRSHPG